MLFRKEEFDEVKILKNETKEGLEGDIKKICEQHILIDLQFGVREYNYFALCLLRKK